MKLCCVPIQRLATWTRWSGPASTRKYFEDKGYLVATGYDPKQVRDSNGRYTIHFGDTKRKILENEFSLGGNPWEYEANKSLVSALVDGLYGALGAKTYPHVMEETLVGATKTLSFEYLSHLNKRHVYIYPDLRSWLLAPVEPVLDHSVKPPCPCNHGGHTGASYVSKWERDNAKAIGEVKKADPSNQQMRIIQTVPRQAELPSTTKGNLVLQLKGHDQSQPLIPGYTLVGRKNDIFAFQRDETDPYIPANVLLATDKKAELSKTYAELGLTDLANVLDRSEQLDVATLVVLLAKHSVYGAPSNLSEADQKSRHMLNFDKFKDLVENGKLHVQCTGAAHFLRLSLEQVFGPGSAQVVTGDTSLKPGIRTINDLGHAQTAFSHGGYMHILDATPFDPHQRPLPAIRSSFSFRRNPGSVQPTAAPSVVQHDKTPAAVAQPKVSFEAAELEQAIERTQAEQLVIVSQNIGRQLLAALQFDTPAQLHKAVSTFKQGDPVRRTLEAALQVSTDSSKAHKAGELVTYLANYRQAPESLRKKVGRTSYDNALLDILEQNAHSLAGTLGIEVTAR